jgi:hypothetical protein
MAETPAARALIEAVAPDSVVYLAQADSTGHFAVGPLNPGTYRVRATLDQNQNHRADRGEAWDSLRVTAPQSGPIELLAVQRDTLPARIVSVGLADSVTLRLVFDRLLDPSQQFPPANFRVAGADSVPIPATAVRTPRDEAALARAQEQQAADSARRADSLAGRPRPAAPRPAAAPAVDSTLKPSRPPPFTTLSVVLARRLAPNTSYRARVTTVRALSGRETGSERSFTTPKPPPPRPAADSTARRGAAAPPRRP